MKLKDRLMFIFTDQITNFASHWRDSHYWVNSWNHYMRNVNNGHFLRRIEFPVWIVQNRIQSKVGQYHVFPWPKSLRGEGTDCHGTKFLQNACLHERNDLRYSNDDLQRTNNLNINLFTRISDVNFCKYKHVCSYYFSINRNAKVIRR